MSEKPISTEAIQQQDTKTEKEKRSERYFANLELLERLSLAEIYPSEVKLREWQAVNDPIAMDEFFEATHGQHYSIMNSSELALVKLYQDPDSGFQFAVSDFGDKNGEILNATRLLLDLLATAKERSPWMKVASLSFDPDKPFFEDGYHWTLKMKHITINPTVLEILFNNIAEAEEPVERKHFIIRWGISKITHESVHINNMQDMVWGGPEQDLGEIGPVAAEYLTYPNENQETIQLFNEAISLLADTSRSHSVYTEAMLLGALLMADAEQLLGPEDNSESLRMGLERWRDMVSALDEHELVTYRRKAEDLFILSDEDIKIRQQLGPLLRRYLKTLGGLHVATLNQDLE